MGVHHRRPTLPRGVRRAGPRGRRGDARARRQLAPSRRAAFTFVRRLAHQIRRRRVTRGVGPEASRRHRAGG